MTRFARPFFIAALLLGLALAGAQVRADEIEKMANSWGPLLEKSKAPELYSIVEMIFAKLEKAQVARNPSNLKFQNSVVILDSPIINAAVIPKKFPEQKVQKNTVFLTTGLIDKYVGALPNAEKSRGLSRLAAVLAHELGHTIEYVDNSGIVATHGNHATGKQAIETRADIEGALLMQKAGFPTEAIYESQAVLANPNGSRASLLDSFFSTHPQDQFRISNLRSFLTAQRYEEGFKPGRDLELHSFAWADELKRLSDGESAWTFKTPNSMQETIERLTAIPSSKNGDLYKKIEFNRLILILDKMVTQAGDHLQVSDESALRNFISFYYKNFEAFPAIFNREEANQWFLKPFKSKEFAQLPTHRVSLKKAPFYNTDIFAKIVSEAPKSQLIQNQASPLAASILVNSNWLSAKKLFATQSTRMIATMNAENPNSARYQPSTANYSLMEPFLGPLSKTSPEYALNLATLYMENRLDKLSPSEKLKEFAQTETIYAPPSRAAGVGTLGGFAQKYEGAGISRDRQFVSLDPSESELLTRYKKQLEKIWNERGLYGALDIEKNYGVNWPMIWETLGINPQVGRQQLIHSVKGYLKSPDYFQLVKNKYVANRLEPRTPPFWMDSTLGPYFAGDMNPLITADPVLHEKARVSFGRTYYYRSPEVSAPIFLKKLSAKLHSGMSPDEFSVAWKSLSSIGGGAYWTQNIPGFAASLAKTIDQSAIDEVTKNTLLKKLFFEGMYSQATYPNRTTFYGDDNPVEVYRTLKKHGLANDPVDYLSSVLQFPGVDESYWKAFAAWAPELRSELNTTLAHLPSDKAKSAYLVTFAKKVIDPSDGTYLALIGADNSSVAALKQNVTEIAMKTSMDDADKVELFRHLTGSGATRATDLFFEKEILPLIEKNASSPVSSAILSMIDDKNNKLKIISQNLRVELAKALTASETKQIAAASEKFSVDQKKVIFDQINKVAPKASRAKDDLLESLGWKFGLSGNELESFVEDSKGKNWRKVDPSALAQGSMVSQAVENLTPAERGQFIDYLINPHEKPFPESLKQAMTAQIYDDNAKLGQSAVKEFSEEAIKKVVPTVHTGIRDLSPIERVPLFDLALSAGTDALTQASNYPYNIARDYLHYVPGSDKEKMLVSFLEVIPEHERTVSLAYLLSQSGEDKGSVNALFEVFQTVGIKFGQLSSVWKLFGDKVAQETKSLKSDAQPIAKASIEKILKETLSPSEYARIRRLKEVLGSASVKTVVRAELVDGRDIAILIQRPNAQAQIDSNLDLTRRFLTQLQKNGVKIPGGMMQSTLDALKAQLGEELKGDLEAKKLKRAKVNYAALNSEMKEDLKGWHFAVPDLIEGFGVRDNLLVMELASGKVLAKAPAASHEIVGPMIARSALRSLFRAGEFNPDQHAGNFLVDEKTKTIFVIDHGQNEKFALSPGASSDDAYLLARFFKALSDRDDTVLMQTALKMRDGARGNLALAPTQMAAIKKVIHAKYASPDEQLISTVNVLAENNVVLGRKFSFGALKGLLVLAGENYVTPKDFTKMMSGEILQIFGRKAPQYLSDEFTRQMNNCERLLQGFLAP